MAACCLARFGDSAAADWAVFAANLEGRTGLSADNAAAGQPACYGGCQQLLQFGKKSGVTGGQKLACFAQGHPSKFRLFRHLQLQALLKRVVEPVRFGCLARTGLSVIISCVSVVSGRPFARLNRHRATLEFEFKSISRPCQQI